MPAIDILDGKVVRLRQGAFDQKTIYSSDPFGVLKNYQDAGLTSIHLVDLSGAENPLNRQTQLMSEILAMPGFKFQIGGGLRSLDDLRLFFDLGAERVVVGTQVVDDTEFGRAALLEFGAEAICFAIDVLIENERPCVVTHGWQKKSQRSFADLINFYQPFGLRHVLCTDVSKDGLKVGPNLELYKSIARHHPDLCLIASGGIRNVQDVHDLSSIPVSAAVVGRALLAGDILLEQVGNYAN